MAERKRTKAVRESDLAEMAVLLAKGVTQRQLAAQFDLSTGTISRDVKTIETRWREQALDEIATWKGRLVAKLELVIADAFAEYERSRSPIEKITETTELIEEPPTPGAVAIDGEIPEPRARMMDLTKRIVSTEGRNADPRYLATVVNAIAEIAKIIGAHAADKIEHSGADGGPLIVTTIRDHVPAPWTGDTDREPTPLNPLDQVA